MPTLQQARNRVENWFTSPLVALGNRSRWQYIQDRQAVYFNNNGRYWQGLRTHTFNIQYSNSSVLEERLADNLLAKPTDLPSTWLDVIPALDAIAMPVVFVMDVYENSDGWGWVLNLEISHNGNLYTRSQNGAGTETNRTQGWAIVADGIT